MLRSDRNYFHAYWLGHGYPDDVVCVTQAENGLILWKKSHDQSGSRHLLILHRALEYVVAFLERLGTTQGQGQAIYTCSVSDPESESGTRGFKKI